MSLLKSHLDREVCSTSWRYNYKDNSTMLWDVAVIRDMFSKRIMRMEYCIKTNFVSEYNIQVIQKVVSLRSVILS